MAPPGSRSLSLISFYLLTLVSQLISGNDQHGQATDLPKTVFKKVVSPGGLMAVDRRTGEILPEELDDGELEGSDKLTTWGYVDQFTWSSEYPICKGKQMRQSPIDIRTNHTVFNPQAKLKFIDYNQEIGFRLKNTHHSLSVLPIANSTPTISVSWLPDVQDFELQEIHFHWGDGLTKGSEHEINDQKAAAEMHMVHYRRGLKAEEIGYKDNSVLVVGILIESNSDEHNKLNELATKASEVNGTDLEYTSDISTNLTNLLPVDLVDFYFYNGSLTTPPCYETVAWVIMRDPVYISHHQLIELTNLEANSFKGKFKIASNNRDIQPLLDRPVYASFNTSESLLRKNHEGFFRNDSSVHRDRKTISSLKATIQSTCEKIINAPGRILNSLGSLTRFAARQIPTMSRNFLKFW